MLLEWLILNLAEGICAAPNTLAERRWLAVIADERPGRLCARSFGAMATGGMAWREFVKCEFGVLFQWWRYFLPVKTGARTKPIAESIVAVSMRR